MQISRKYFPSAFNKMLMVVFGLITLSLSATAQDTPSRNFSASVGESVNEALKLIKLYNYNRGVDILNTLLERTDLNAYEKSVILQLKGSAHYELKQTKLAIEAFEGAIASGGLLPSEANQLRRNIAQLHISEGNYTTGAEMIEQWERGGNELKPIHIELLVQAWVSANNYQRALPWAEKWFENANPKERKHFDLLNFLYNNLAMHDKQAGIIEQMTARWPEDKSLWDALSSNYANAGRERDAFEIQRMLYLSGVLKTEWDILKIVQYHAFYDMPYQAAGILEDEISRDRVTESTERLVQLSDLYRQAREYERADAILRKAVEMTDKKTVEKIKKYLREPIKTRYSHASYLAELYPELEIPPFKVTQLERNDKIQVSDRDAQPLVRISAIMPANAEKSGHCKVRFKVDRAGIPYNIQATFCTLALFKDASIDSVKKWKFNPKIVNGRAVERNGTEAKITFRLADKRGKIIPE